MSLEEKSDGISLQTLQEVQDESIRAHDKHGYAHTMLNPALSRIRKLAALMEEVGEVAELFTYDKGSAETSAGLRQRLHDELIQVASVAASWAECEALMH